MTIQKVVLRIPFYPSEQLYCFTDPESKKTKMRHLMRDSLEIETLLSQGWIKSTNFVPHPEINTKMRMKDVR